jgi:hypothetical protein
MDTKDMFLEFRKEIVIRRNNACKELSLCDLREQDLLHFLENENCDAVAMIKVAKGLKEVRYQRRCVKIELDKCNSIYSAIEKKNLDKFEEKTYEYKTDVLKNIAHRKKGDVTRGIHIKKEK